MTVSKKQYIKTVGLKPRFNLFTKSTYKFEFGVDGMAKRVEGVTEKLLESAKKEFLKSGYENASLQVIAEKAGSSKGAIYIRYPDKKSLYCALVGPTADEFCNLLEGELHRFKILSSDEQKEKVMTFGNDGFSKVIAYIYDHSTSLS